MANSKEDDAPDLQCPICGKILHAPAPSAAAKALRYRCEGCLATVYVNRESPAVVRAMGGD